MTTPIEETIVASMQAEIERLQAELAQTKLAAKEPLFDDDALTDAFENVGFSEYAADAFSTALVDAKRVRDTYEVEIRRLQAAAKQYTLDDVVGAMIGEANTVSNPVEQYIQIQDYQNRSWHTLSQRFAMDKQQAISDLGKWRERFPAGKFRLVSVTVTLLGR